MFKNQKIILESAPALQELASKYPDSHSPSERDRDASPQWVRGLESRAHDFVVRVPFIGAFSAGKSTLLNALLEDGVFTTSIDPQTALPAEASWGAQEKFIGYKNPDDTLGVPLTREQVRNNELGHLGEKGWVDARLPSPTLKALPHLRLVDMPGWDSGISRHSQAIDNYVDRSIAYCVVVSADEGTLHSSIAAALNELKLHNKPIIAVITKAEKKTPEDAQEIAEQVGREIAKYIDKTPLRTVITSAHKKDVGQLKQALAELEQLAETLFDQHVTSSAQRDIGTLAGHIKTLANAENLNVQQVELEILEQQKAVIRFEEQFASQTQDINERVPAISKRISQEVRVALEQQSNELVSLALSRGDLSAAIGQTARVAIAEGIKNEFEPIMQDYLTQVSDSLPAFSIQSHMQLDSLKPEIELDTTAIKSVLTVLLGVLVFKVPVLGKFLAAPIVALLVDGIASMIKGNQAEMQVQEQREQARQHILQTVIPQALAQIAPELERLLRGQIDKAQQAIEKQVQQERDSQQAALEQLLKNLQVNQEEYAAQQQSYAADLAQVEAIYASLYS